MLNLDGEWSSNGEPCAIIQKGRILKLINFDGAEAVGRIDYLDKFLIIKAEPPFEYDMSASFDSQSIRFDFQDGSTAFHGLNFEPQNV
jgi:hypothetical protein